MNIRTSLWLWALAGLLALTGCGAIFGEAEVAEEPVRRLNFSDWPTPIPTATPVTPTPFPKITAVPTSTPETASAASETSDSGSSEQTSAAPGINVDDIINRGVQLVTEQYPVLGIAFTIVEEAPIRGAPGEQAAVLTRLEKGELLGFNGIDSNREYIYGIGTDLTLGWIAIEDVRITGRLEEAPVLPADPVQLVLQQLGVQVGADGSVAPVSNGNQTTGSTAGGGAQVAIPQLAATELPALTTGQSTISGLNVRQGPGTIYELLGQFEEDEQVDVIATNRLNDWVLVQGENLAGWVSLDFLTLDTPVEQLTVVRSALPETGIPSGTVAPIVQVIDEAPSTLATTVVRETGSGFGSITSALIARPEVDLHRGPARDFGVLDTLTSTDIPVNIWAQDESGAWVLAEVQDFNKNLGWIAAEDLNIDGAVEDAPVVLTGWIDSNGVDVFDGPAIYNNKTGIVNLNDLVSIIGLDDDRSWVLIEPIRGGGLGWISTRFITVNGRLADVPAAPDVVLTAAVEEEPVPLDAPPIAPRSIDESQMVLQLQSGREIVVINPDGSGLRPLTTGIDPDLSPDGQEVVFTRWVGDIGTVFVTDIDGGNERAILGETTQAKGASWSPDGSQIMINFQQGGRIEPTEQCELLKDGFRPPLDAYDIDIGIDEKGRPEICFKLPEDPYWSLRLIDVTTSEFQDVDGGTYAFRPAWDPSQPWRVVTDGGRGLLGIDVNRVEYRERLSEEVNDTAPVFSPDGRYIVISVGPRGGGAGHNIIRMNRDGSGRTLLTETPLFETIAPDGDGKQWNNVAPAWSPDGSKIVFLTDRNGAWELWSMNVDGSEQQPFFSEEISAQLDFEYNFVDERVVSWR